VRVEPSGDAVVAGHAAPQAHVELRDEGRAIAEVDADPSGQFVIIPPQLGSGSHQLQLAVRGADALPLTSDAVPVEVATPKVAVAQRAPPPAKSAPQVSPPAKPAAAPPPATPAAVLASVQTPPDKPLGLQPSGQVFVETVEATEAGRLQVKGSAEPNATVRLYLNGSFVADASAGADRQWSLTIEHGMAPGLYTMRADEIDRADGRVLARAEAPFAYPLHPTAAGPSLASAATPQPAATAQPAPVPTSPSASTPVASADGPSDKPPAHVVVAEVQTTTVVRGDNLWDLARRYYGDGMQFRQIYEANSSQIRDPSLIYVGQIFVVPKQASPSN
jgi:nucleoid-associated protein YgaU